MRIDLHAHSNRSDGTAAPDVLVEQAALAGLDVVALTDHDTFAGWDLAVAAARRFGIGLLPGAEVSCRYAGRSVHLLAYLPDPTYPPLRDELERIRRSRDERVPLVIERLAAHGVTITVEDVAAGAKDATSLGRPHIADALVRRGYATDRRAALDQWLGEGKPGYVPRYAPEPRSAIALVRAAGGVPVLAHPRGRASRVVVDDEVIADLAAAGLAGLEVDHTDHDRATWAGLRGLANALGLIVTGASDHHGSGKVGHALGCETTAPDQLEQLLECARRSAAAAGRGTSPVVSPAWRAASDTAAIAAGFPDDEATDRTAADRAATADGADGTPGKPAREAS